MAIEALVFDLGGVVIDIDFKRIFEKWSDYSGKPVGDIENAFAVDLPYLQHERGEIDSRDYYRQVCANLQLKLSYEQFCDGWNAIMVAPINPTIALIEALSQHYPVYALSNANPLHQAYWETNYAAQLRHFRRIFVSSELGCRKPEAQSFHHVSRHAGVALEHLVMFDDLAENIAAADTLGMQTVLVRSPQDIADFVASEGLLQRAQRET